MNKIDFYHNHCRYCGSQRCEGPESEWFNGCEYRKELNGYENSEPTLHETLEEINNPVIMSEHLDNYIRSLSNKEVNELLKKWDKSLIPVEPPIDKTEKRLKTIETKLDKIIEILDKIDILIDQVHKQIF